MSELREVKLSDILVEDRLREDMGKIEGLIKSIGDRGLIQSLAIVKIEYKPSEMPGLEKDLQYGIEPHSYRLLAGGRRYEACKVLKMEEVPVIIFDSMNTYDMKVIELMENLQREALTWQEELRGKKELHELQVSIHGGVKKVSGPSIGWSERDTAMLTGDSQSNLNRDLRLAEALVEIPELADVKTKGEAQKILAKAQDMVLVESIAKDLKEKRAKTPIEKQRADICNNFIIKDFFEGVREIPDSSLDLIEIDPPYAIDLKGLKRTRTEGGEHDSVSTAGYNEIDIKEYPVFLANTLTNSYRTLKNGGWLLFWFDIKKFGQIYDAVEKAGFTTRRIPMVWNKGTGQTLHPQLHLASAYEVCLYAWKGNPVLNRMGRSNVYDYKPVHSSKKIHPTERPIEMIQDLLNTFVRIEARVMVPYLGSGNTLLAANNLGMHCFGYDLSSNFKDEFTVRVHDQEPGKFNSYGGGEGDITYLPILKTFIKVKKK